MKFDQIEHEILEKVQKQVKDKDYGIEIKFVQIKKMGLPESVTQNVFDRMQSERQVLISTIQFEGEAEATKIKSSADSKAAILLADADAAALKIQRPGRSGRPEIARRFAAKPRVGQFQPQARRLGTNAQGKDHFNPRPRHSAPGSAANHGRRRQGWRAIEKTVKNLALKLA